MASLTWEQVVKYTFLADFDILRNTRAEVQSMDTNFKIEHAQEELVWLNIKIRQMITWICDEGHFLR
jgi:hypothetical protein